MRPCRKSSKSILISGAGIAGPTLAYWLGQAGLEPTLIEHGRALSGATHEPCTYGRARTLYATLAGSRQGSAIAFRKTYDSAVPGYHVVDYAGTLNAEATEIDGRWTIAGAWSGRFMMIRESRVAAGAERTVKARA